LGRSEEDHAMNPKMLIPVSIAELQVPKHDHITVLNCWWALDTDGCAIFYRTGTWSITPQCNGDKRIAESLSGRMYSGRVVYIPAAYVPQQVSASD